MDGKRRWLSWVAIGLGALALLVALGGRAIGSQFGPGFADARSQLSFPQQNIGPQNSGPQAGPAAPGGNAQLFAQRHGRQGGAPDTNAQPNNAQPQDRQQGGPAGPSMGGQPRRGEGRPGNGGFGPGGWLQLPGRLIGGSFKTGMIILLLLVGFWLLRRRNGPTPATQPAAAQPPLSPTGEAYTEESSDSE